MKAFTCLFHAALIGAVILTQLAATPTKPVPYNVNWYIHPQRMVDVGGRRLNVVCVGRGSPTVILEAGLLADASAWRLVQPAVSRNTRVCSYDRAGLGFSNPANDPRDGAAIVRDLHALLHNAHIAGPYVLVGWSSGGPYTRLYQYTYAKEVVGLVEVDPDNEFYTLADAAQIATSMMHKPLSWYNDQQQAWEDQFANCAKNVARGTCAFFPSAAAYLHADGCPNPSDITCKIAVVRAEHLAQPSFWEDEALEVRSYDKTNSELRAAARPYSNLPLIVLTDSEEGDIDNSPGPIPIAVQRVQWGRKDNSEEHLARLSTVGAHFVVAGSQHAILLDHPAAVISAIDEVVDQARYSRR